MAARPATVALACSIAVAVVVTMMATVEHAEAGQNCICECMKLCIRTNFPDMEECEGKCKEMACVRSCEEACVKKGYPKQPHEGIPTCELEPLSPDEKKRLCDDHGGAKLISS